VSEVAAPVNANAPEPEAERPGTDASSFTGRRAKVRAPVFSVFIELYEAALEAMPPDRRRRRA
jgi:hypothetical protein